MRVQGSHLRQSGQAAVEAALTLPMVVFLVLGTLQLFMLLQGRIMAQYAAHQAVRAGSVNFGDCTAMNHAAIGALLPSVHPFVRPGLDPVTQLVDTFGKRKGNKYFASEDGQRNGPIVWVIRESPLRGTVPSPEDREFDEPGKAPVRLEVRVVFWYPMEIPFANWVMTQIYLARFGFKDYHAANPFMVRTRDANWVAKAGAAAPTRTFERALRDEFALRASLKQYVFPVQASYSMRMMTPPRSSRFTTQNCAPAPDVLN